VLSAGEQFDVVFIDGLHHADQVYRDVKNAMRRIPLHGAIVLHDCNPMSRAAQAVPRQQAHWNGDCWKAIVEVRRKFRSWRALVIDSDQGLGVIVPRAGEKPPLRTLGRSAFTLSYRDLASRRKQLLGLVSAKDWFAHVR
jgi:hypothetical protein